jgi:hypothetical protein
MALSEISYPVTGSPGSYSNIFPSQKPLFAEFARLDASIVTIVSGIDAKVRITASAVLTDIEEGQFITWGSDGYTLRSSRVVNIVSPTTIEVEDLFTNTNAANGFINYHRDYFLEIRYVAPDSVSNDQSAIELIDDYSQIPNTKNGDIKANISYPSDLLVPEFSLSQGIQNDLFTEYKIQFRESYDGNRAGLWSSPVLDEKIMLVHASLPIDSNVFTDSVITKRFIKGYPLIYTMQYSNINDDPINDYDFEISVDEIRVNQTVIQNTILGNVLNLNGVYLIVLDTNTISSDAAFLQFSYSKTISAGQYDTGQYDPAQYA